MTVFERSSEIGGLAATRESGGLRFDYGPHRFHTKSSALQARISGLLGDDLLTLERKSRIRLLDRYFRYPLELGDVLRRMPLHQGAGMVASYVWSRTRRALAPSDEGDFESWVVGRFGRRLYDIYFGPYTAKLWGRPPSSLSSDWASQRISVPSLSGLIRETLSPGESGARSLVSTFSYPRTGIGRIAEALAARLAAAGGSIETGVRPERIEPLSDGCRIWAAGGEHDFDAVINSAPLDEYVRLLGKALPDDLHEAASELRFRAVVFVTLRLSGRCPAPDHWIYTPEAGYEFNRLSIPENFDAAMSGTGGQITFEFSCQEGDATWEGGDELSRASVEGGAKLGLLLKEKVQGSTITRQSHAYPVYDIGYSARTNAILDALQALPRSVTCGRQGMFRYNNMDHSIMMGEYAALELLGEGLLRDMFDWSKSTWADG